MDNETFDWYKNLLAEFFRRRTGDEEEAKRESSGVDLELCDCAEKDMGLKSNYNVISC